jgi:hypothetical protein
MQTITFTAPSGGELRQQMLDFLGIIYPAQTRTLPSVPVEEIAEPVTEIKSRGKVAKKLAGVLPPGIQEAAQATPEPQGSEAPAPVPGQAFDGHEPVTPSPSTLDKEEVEQIVVAPPKEALELKEKVINLLQEAFRAGKVQKVRSVLATYGNGAKSFREIEIGSFPEIEKALMRGALN